MYRNMIWSKCSVQISFHYVTTLACDVCITTLYIILYDKAKEGTEQNNIFFTL